MQPFDPVSYTHLDVYKRQELEGGWCNDFGDHPIVVESAAHDEAEALVVALHQVGGECDTADR